MNSRKDTPDFPKDGKQPNFQKGEKPYSAKLGVDIDPNTIKRIP